MKRSNIYWFSCLLIVWVLPGIVLCASHNIRSTNLGPKDGLSQVTIYSILQDNRGFMWFGTLDGLNRYDGNKFVVYRHNPDDPASINHNQVDVVYQGNDGALWLGSGKGLNKFDPNTETFTNYQIDIDNQQTSKFNFIIEIQQDDVGNLWLGTEGGIARV